MAETQAESRTRWLPILIPAAIAAVVAIFTSTDWDSRINDWWTKRQIGLSITDPKETSSAGTPTNVPTIYTISGTIGDVPVNRELWVIVQVAEKANGYYPQGAAELDDDGERSCVVGYGSQSPDEGGNRYRIYAALADPTEQSDLRDWVYDDLPSATTGMEDYPGDNLDHVTFVDVVRSASDDPTIEGAVNQPGCSA